MLKTASKQTPPLKNQKGVAHLLLIVAALGVIGFLIFSSIAPFKNNFFANIFPKGWLFATGEKPLIEADPIKFSPNYNTIAIEVKFKNDTNRTAVAKLQFKKDSEPDTAWKDGLDLWRVDPNDNLNSNGVSKPIDSYGKAFYGSVLQLEQNTAYKIRVTVEDPVDGVDGQGVLEQTVSTRDGKVAEASTLSPTHYIRSNGDDAKDGTSVSTAWKTLEKAITVLNAAGAPANPVIEVGPGYFTNAKTPAARPMTFKAQFPAVDDNQNLIAANVGNHSVILPGDSISGIVAMSCPAGGDCPYPNKWVQVTNMLAKGLPGDNITAGSQMLGPGGAFPTASIWVWVNAPINTPRTMGYASNKSGEPQQIANWDITDGEKIDSPEGFIEKMLTNTSYNYGFSSFNTGKNLYLRLPPNAPSQNPNDLYITVGGAGRTRAIDFLSGGSRFSGFETRNFYEAVNFEYNATLSQNPNAGSIVDHNLLIGRSGVNFEGLGPSSYLANNLVEHNVIKWNNMRGNGDEPVGHIIPWNFVKRWIRNANGTVYQNVAGTDRKRLGGLSEGSAVGGADGGAMNTVVRYNTIDGTWDGGTHATPEGFDRYAGYNFEVHDNLIQNLSDDPVEPGGHAVNWKFYNNTVKNTNNFASLDGSKFGPGYIFRNTAYRVGFHGSAYTKGGGGQKPEGVVGNFFKTSAASVPASKVYIVNNTFWTQYFPSPPDTVLQTSGGDQVSGAIAFPKTSERFFLRNNLFRVASAPWDMMAGSKDATKAWDEDYNYWYAEQTGKAFSYYDSGTVQNFNNISDYRIGTCNGVSGGPACDGVHSNVGAPFNGFRDLSDSRNNPDGWLNINSSAGTVTTKPISAATKDKLIDMGVEVPNISVKYSATDKYKGCAPDIGNSDLSSDPMCDGYVDLQVSDVSWSPSTVYSGTSTTFSATVKNAGTLATTQGNTIKVLFKVDGNIVSWADTETASLAAGDTVTVTANAGANGATWAAALGDHTVTAEVDDGQLIAESVEDNNIFSKDITVAAPPIDLIVSNVIYKPADAYSNTPVTFSASVKNQGLGATPDGTVVKVLFKVDGQVVSWSDTRTTSIAPGASFWLSANSGPNGSAAWTATLGDHTVTAEVDDTNLITESNETNNTITKNITFELPPPDLVVTNILWSPAIPAIGTPVTLSATVKNQGVGPTPEGTAITVQFKVDGSEVSISNYRTVALPVGQSINLTGRSATWTPSEAKTYTISAEVDYQNTIQKELSETNNTFTKNITIK